MKTFFITGAEGVGKTSIIQNLKQEFPEMEIYDFDEVGVPENPPLQWRIDTTKFWINKAKENSQKGKSTAIIGLSFPSEIKSFKELKDTNFLLLDITKEERTNRLNKRNAPQELIEDLDQLLKLKKKNSKITQKK